MTASARRLVVALALALPGWAVAEGFATRDLTTVDLEPYAGRASDGSVEPTRALLLLSQEPTLALEVRIGDAEPGLAARVRSGETTMTDLEARCDANAAETGSRCLDLAAASRGGALGWRTRTRSGLEMTTHALVDGDDLLMVTAAGADRARVDALADEAAAALAPRILAP